MEHRPFGHSSIPGPSTLELGALRRALASANGTNPISVLYVGPDLGSDELQGLLPSPDWDAYEARTVSEALDLYARKRPAAILCERAIGSHTWRELLLGILLLPDPPPLIVACPLADQHFWAEALNLGAYDVLAKPFDANDLGRALTSALLHRRTSAPVGTALTADA